MIRLTYGTLPSYEDFEAQFAASLGEDGIYKIEGPQVRAQSSRSLESRYAGQYSARELWHVVEYLTAHHNEEDTCEANEAGDFVSCILSTLEIEWI